ncbi:class I SAM-dependent methyltransferase [Oryzihumus sp.]|uniref:class I SAM-dependent methyltransferase n=1 Tax=Oryzihumus sp. TaxID=1968903 RepID=UPI002EDACE4E
MDPVQVDLGGVPETLLWNLYQRASEARQDHPVLRDPKAVELVEAIDYPFAARFGSGELGQWQALRAATFDREVRRFLRTHPDGTVVALGEGLETQFWRVDNGRVHWLTVDLPETVDVRTRLLGPATGRQSVAAVSALDPAWMDRVDPRRGVLVTAQGLLMYLQPEEVHGLVAALAQRFPGAETVLDGVPPWFSRRTRAGQMRTRQGYVTPPMPWALDASERRRLLAIPGVDEVQELVPPRGRGVLHGWVAPVVNRSARVRALGLTGLPILRLRFAAA